MKRIKIRLLFVLVLVFIVSLCLGQSADLSQQGIIIKRDSLLKHYSFVRTSFSDKNIDLLIGNSLMGGLVLQNGLGFDSIWCASLWEDKHNRIPLQGVKLITEKMNNFPPAIKNYSQTVSLKNATAETRMEYENGFAYESILVFSNHNKHLLVMRLKDISKSGQHKWVLRVPYDDYDYVSAWPEYKLVAAKNKLFIVNKISDYALNGSSADSIFTPCDWTLKSNIKLIGTGTPNQFTINTSPGDELLITFCFATKWDDKDYKILANKLVNEKILFDQLLSLHQKQWQRDWNKTPLLLIPDKKHEELFYRSIYWLFVQAGCEHFLPGESQFAQSCWNMRPFTYGAAGWSVLAFEAIGHPEKAMNMLKVFYKPDALKQNAALYIKDSLKRKDAFSFAHEVSTDGTTAITFDEQRHLNAFALFMYHRYYQLYPDDKFLNDYLYPVAKGVAEFWRGLAIWNDSLKAYIFPKLRSVSEDLFSESLMDIVFPAIWSLDIAIMYAKQCNKDPQLQQQWINLKNKIYVPQNKDYFLEFLGDNGNRMGGGYNGIRAPFYLGYPTVELIQNIDKEKALRTMDKTWERNRQGEDMLGFIASWFALAETQYGRGDKALEIANQNFNCFDSSGTALTEGPRNRNRFYFLTSSSSYLLIPIQMMMQLTADKPIFFPSMPSSWKDAAFYNLTVNNHQKKSAVIKKNNMVGKKQKKQPFLIAFKK